MATTLIHYYIKQIQQSIGYGAAPVQSYSDQIKKSKYYLGETTLPDIITRLQMSGREEPCIILDTTSKKFCILSKEHIEASFPARIDKPWMPRILEATTAGFIIRSQEHESSRFEIIEKDINTCLQKFLDTIAKKETETLAQIKADKEAKREQEIKQKTEAIIRHYNFSSKLSSRSGITTDLLPNVGDYVIVSNQSSETQESSAPQKNVAPFILFIHQNDPKKVQDYALQFRGFNIEHNLFFPKPFTYSIKLNDETTLEDENLHDLINKLMLELQDQRKIPATKINAGELLYRYTHKCSPGDKRYSGDEVKIDCEYMESLLKLKASVFHQTVDTDRRRWQKTPEPFCQAVSKHSINIIELMLKYAPPVCHEYYKEKLQKIANERYNASKSSENASICHLINLYVKGNTEELNKEPHKAKVLQIEDLAPPLQVIIHAPSDELGALADFLQGNPSTRKP